MNRGTDDGGMEMGEDLGRERWLPVVGYEGVYEVSSLGRVRSVRPRFGDGILRGDVDRYGYRRVLLSRDAKSVRFKVHRLVCTAFHGEPPPGHQVAHLDGNKTNNVADNLKWATRAENNSHKDAHGTHPIGMRNGRTRLTSEQVAEIRAKVAAGATCRPLARQYGVYHTTIHRIASGESRRHG